MPPDVRAAVARAERRLSAAFEALVALCGAATIVFAVMALVAVGARPERFYAAAAFLGLAPLALGPCS